MILSIEWHHRYLAFNMVTFRKSSSSSPGISENGVNKRNPGPGQETRNGAFHSICMLRIVHIFKVLNKYIYFNIINSYSCDKFECPPSVFATFAPKMQAAAITMIAEARKDRKWRAG